MKNKKFAKYFKEYEWSNIFAMIRNNRLDPKICALKILTINLLLLQELHLALDTLQPENMLLMGANLLCVNRNPAKIRSFMQ